MSQKNRERIASAVQAAFETMETRRLMSTVQVVDGVLIIDADPHTASNIIVDFNGANGRVRGYVTGAEATYAASEITAVQITGSDGDDNIYIDPRLSRPTLVRAGAGNDRVRGGAGVDVVDAGPGNDTVHGGRGDDRVSAGEGDDTVHGNVGNDVIDGGAGNDSLYGQDGNDTIYGGEGFDLLAGLGGDDELHGGAGDDRLDGSLGNDNLFGGAGDDAMLGHGGNDALVGGDGFDLVRGGKGRNDVRGGGTNGAPTAGDDLIDDPVVTPPPADNGSPMPPVENPPVEPPPVQNPPPVDNTPPVETPPDNGNNNGGGDDNETPPPSTRAPRPVIRMIGDADRIVGTAVHVHGLDSDLNGGTALTARYDWDFGDPNGRYNKLTGFNAAHVYDQPGVYTITLTVTNDKGRSAVARVSMNVSADDRPTIYVDNSRGDDDNDGSSPSKAVRTAQRAFNLAGDDTRVLFKRGQRFTIDRGITINEDRVLVGAYGTGKLPVLYRVEGTGESVFRTSDTAEDVTFEDLRFDSPYKADPDERAPKIPVTAVFVGGTNITLRDIEFGEISHAINSNQDPTGMLVMDTVVTSPVGMRGYHVWGEGTDLVILGNKSTNSTREHNVRTSGAVRQLVAYNDFAQTDRIEDDPGDIQKGTIEIHRGAYAYVAENTVHGGVIRTGPRGYGYETPETRTEWCVIENNRFDDVGIHLHTGSEHIMIRNNVIERYKSMRHGSAINLQSRDPDGRDNDEIYILNNTVIDRRTSGSFLRLDGEQAEGGITVLNNIWISTKFRAGHAGSAAIYVSEDNLKSFKEVSGNIWATPKSAAGWARGGVTYVNEDWGVRGGYKTPQQWNDYDQVGTDYFVDVELTDSYQVRYRDTLAGATLEMAA